MIGRSPAVLKINKQTNRAKCFFVPAFQSAIPFRTASQTIKSTSKTIVPPASAVGNACVAIAVVSGVIVV